VHVQDEATAGAKYAPNVLEHSQPIVASADHSQGTEQGNGMID
jgi:hypothetical protein